MEGKLTYDLLSHGKTNLRTPLHQKSLLIIAPRCHP